MCSIMRLTTFLSKILVTSEYRMQTTCVVGQSIAVEGSNSKMGVRNDKQIKQYKEV